MRSSRVANSGSRSGLSGIDPSAGLVSEARPALAEAKTTGTSRTASRSSPGTSSCRSAARPSSRSVDSCTTSSMRASDRSTLLTTSTTGSLASSALRSTKRVCGNGPSEASTSSSTPSTMERPRSTSPPKSAWPGVSMMLMVTPSGSPASAAAGPRYRTVVFLARIVIPFSRSRSPVSMARSSTCACAPKAPDCQSMASTRVVLPWSTWATIATLRRSERTGMRGLISRRGVGARAETSCAQTDSTRSPCLALSPLPAPQPAEDVATSPVLDLDLAFLDIRPVDRRHLLPHPHPSGLLLEEPVAQLTAHPLLAGVVVLRLAQDLVAGPLLDQLRVMHHRDAGGQDLDHREVMADEQAGEPVLALQLLEQVKHPRLHGHVKGRGRLVRNEQLGREGERPGDAHTLTLAAGQLVRVPVAHAALEVDLVQQVLHLPVQLRPGGDLVQQQRLPDRLPDRQPGVQGGSGVLEDDRDVPAQLAQLLRADAGHLVATDPQGARHDRQEADHGTSDGGLAGAGLPYQADDLTPVDGQVDGIDLTEGRDAPATRVLQDEPLRRHHRLGGAPLSL